MCYWVGPYANNMRIRQVWDTWAAGQVLHERMAEGQAVPRGGQAVPRGGQAVEREGHVGGWTGVARADGWWMAQVCG